MEVDVPETEASSVSEWIESPGPEPLPLSQKQRVAATVVGAVLVAAGGVSVFLADNQAGSVALLLVGAAFLLIALSGMPMLGTKVKDFELNLAWRWRQTVREVANRLSIAEGRQLLLDMDLMSPHAYSKPLTALIDFLGLMGHVRDAVIAVLEDGDHIEARRSPVIGDPLVEWLPAQRDVRIGVYAMFAPSDPGTISSAFSDQFVRQLPHTGCAALIMITCVRDPGDLAALAARITQEVGLPVAVEEWATSGKGRPLRPAIDRLVTEVREGRA